MKLAGSTQQISSGSAQKFCPNGWVAAMGDSEVRYLIEQGLAAIVLATGAVSGVVRLLSADGKILRLLAQHQLPEIIEHAELRVDSDCGACGLALQSGEISAAGVQACVQRCGTAHYGVRCEHVQAVPLRDEQIAQPFGVLTLYYANAEGCADNQFVASHARLLELVIHSALRHMDQQNKAVQSERRSMSNEIHDALAQTLYFTKMRSSLLLEAMRTENQLLAFKCARDIDDALEESQRSVRQLVTSFRCQMDPEGLKAALRRLVDEFGERGEIALEYTDNEKSLLLPPEYELQTLLIVREALINVSTHSGASKARLTVARENDRYVFTVEDNGKGLQDAPAEGHYGLTIMRERAARIDGELQIENLDGAGMRVRLSYAAPAARMELEE